MTQQEFIRCIQEYGRDIYSFCRHLTNDPAEGDDLYQDTLLTAAERLERIEYDGNPKAYLLSVALRIWRNRKRKFAWRKRIAPAQPLLEERDAQLRGPTEPSPEERMLDRERAAAIRAAVDRLPEKLKVVVLLFYMEDLQTARIGKMLNIPVGTVLSRLHQARKILKKELEDMFDEGTD